MKSFKYCVLDVFSNERYKGNPLSVVFTDGTLALDIYEKISREFGYAETSFIYYSAPEKALKVRSFTPTGFEVSGAGHNLLGAVCAALFKDMDIFREQENDKFVIMKDRAIPLLTEHSNNALPFVTMTQKSAQMQTVVDANAISAALSLDVYDLLDGDLRPTVVKTEVAHLMIGVKSLESLNKLTSNKALLSKLAIEHQFQGVYCFAFLTDGGPYLVQTRFFNPGIGIDEDAATGSAAGPLAGFLFEMNYIRQDTRYQLLQGVQMNQPSVINFEVKKDGIEISGTSVVVMDGIIYT